MWANCNRCVLKDVPAIAIAACAVLDEEMSTGLVISVTNAEQIDDARANPQHV
jgi:hypothetical protein